MQPTNMGKLPTLNIVFSVTYYLELHNVIYVIMCNLFYQVKMLMFYNVQITSVAFVGKQWDIQHCVILISMWH